MRSANGHCAAGAINEVISCALGPPNACHYQIPA